MSETGNTPTEVAGSTAPRIVVGVDGSEASLDAFRHAVQLAKALEHSLVAVTAWDYPTSMYDVYYPEPGWSPENDAVRILTDATQKVFGDLVPNWFSTSAHRGTPARALLKESETAEMLVVGSRGHGGFVGLMVGSVSTACVGHAHCPVLVVHHRAHESGEPVMETAG